MSRPFSDERIRLTARGDRPGEEPAGPDADLGDGHAGASRQEQHPSWQLAFDGTLTPAKNFLFVLLVVGWIFPGLLGHEPWKPDEAYTFGVVYDYLQGGRWLVPTLAGEPFLDKPPLFYLLAAACAWLASPVLELHDGARLATALCMAATVLATMLTGRKLYGERHDRITAIILLGTLGLVLRSHSLIPDVGLLAGFAASYHGLAVARERPVPGGLLLGVGAGFGFLCVGMFVPVVLALTVASLAAASPAFRTRQTALAAALAVAVLLPCLAVWPWLLFRESPELFRQWFFDENWDRVFGFLNRGIGLHTLFFAANLPWYGWPALPLACWTLWRGGQAGLARPEILLPVVCFAVAFTVASLAGSAREVHGMPLTIPMALLAGAGIDTLRRGAASALDWFGMMTFGLFSLGLWLGWLTLASGSPPVLAQRLAAYQPAYRFEFHGWVVLFAVALSLVYYGLVLRAQRSTRRAVVNWTAGITVFWMLAMTLWLPYIDTGKSYRAMVLDLRSALPAQPGCVASRNLGEPQRAVLDYYIGLTTRRLETGRGSECRYLLHQGTASETPRLGGEWRQIWSGSRPGDYVERFRLYQRVKTMP